MKQEKKMTRNEKITLSRLVKAGKTNGYIAFVLKRSLDTVKAEREKLGKEKAAR